MPVIIQTNERLAFNVLIYYSRDFFCTDAGFAIKSSGQFFKRNFRIDNVYLWIMFCFYFVCSHFYFPRKQLHTIKNISFTKKNRFNSKRLAIYEYLKFNIYILRMKTKIKYHSKSIRLQKCEAIKSNDSKTRSRKKFEKKSHQNELIGWNPLEPCIDVHP